MNLIAIAAESAQTKPITTSNELFPNQILESSANFAIILIGLVSAYITLSWMFKTARKRPSYKHLVKTNRNTELPLIALLPWALVIFLIVLFTRECLAGTLIYIFNKSIFELDFHNPEITDTIVFAYISIIASIAVLVLFFGLIKSGWKFPVFKALFQARHRNLRDVLASSLVLGFTTVFIYTIAAVIWFLILNQFHIPLEEQSQIQQLRSTGDINLWIPMVLAIIIIAPIYEEILFRGLLYVGLRKYLPAGIAAIVQGLIFAGAHYSLPAFLPLLILGVLLALMFERYKSLLPSIIAHSLFNSITIISILSTHY